MPKVQKDPDREKRIEMEIIVDAYDESERAMGWYYFIEGKLSFPFWARSIAKRPISPLVKNEKVRVEGMAPEEECEKEIFVMVVWEKRRLAVPLSQLEALDVDDQTREAIEDWRYWVTQGYQF